MKIPKKIAWHTEPLAELRKLQGITRLQGNLDSKFLLIAPVPTQAELEANLPWCDYSARRFFTYMQNTHGLTPNSFLIMPTTYNGQKVKKDTTAPGQRIFKAAVESGQFTHFIAIGSDAFKTYFGYGKKPKMGSLAGHIMYLEIADYHPVFVFPDLNALRITPDDKFPTKRDWAIANFACQNTMTALDKLSPAFANFLKARKVQ